ncbi:MAG: phage terminase large subunit [Gemmatimonadales bacterium]
MKLTPKQEQANRLLSTSAKHILLDGGSRSGKSAVLVRAICTRAIKAPKSRHAILRFRFKHVKESIGLDTLPTVMAKCFPGVPYDLNKSDWYVTLPNRSEIWLGGLDDKERTEKILGKEFASIYLNECSQIPWTSRNLAVTRLAQNCPYTLEGEQKTLALKMYYDCNPPSKSHWSYQVFYLKRDPETKRPLTDADNYAQLTLNPGDNEANLPADYIRELQNLPARLRRRFLEGAYGEVAPGALWTEEMISMARRDGDELPDMQRVIVAVDPSGCGDEDNTENDAIGIIVAGLGTDGYAYVLEDLTVKAGPKVWGNIVATAFDRHRADKVVAETNYGGEMVGFVVKAAKPSIPFKKLTASRGKVVRAEPISALTEQGKIRFAGTFAELEDELCSFTTNGFLGANSPNRADAFVWAMSELFPGLAKEQEKKVERKSLYQPQFGSAGWMA